jgi:hypothetical protein
MRLLYAVDVRQSQSAVAGPNGGNRLHPTICFFGFVIRGMKVLGKYGQCEYGVA